MKFFTLRESYFAFYPAVFQIQASGHDGQAALPRGLKELIDFPPMQQELARPGGRVVGAVAVTVFADVGVQQPGFVFFHRGIGIAKLNLPARAAFTSVPVSAMPGFISIQKKEVMSRLPVIAENLEPVSLSGQICYLFLLSMPVCMIAASGPGFSYERAHRPGRQSV